MREKRTSAEGRNHDTSLSATLEIANERKAMKAAAAEGRK